ncbi:MAG: hypothetical protein ABSD71_02365 [Bacteroidales bacterium]
MRKIFILVIYIVFSFAANAQNPELNTQKADHAMSTLRTGLRR